MVATVPEALPVGEDGQHEVGQGGQLEGEEVARVDQVAQEAGGHRHPQFDYVVECEIGNPDHVLGQVPAVVVLVAQLPQELAVVHEPVLEVPRRLEPQHVEQHVLDHSQRTQPRHPLLGGPREDEAVQPDLGCRQQDEVGLHDSELRPEVGERSQLRLEPPHRQEDGPGKEVQSQEGDQPVADQKGGSAGALPPAEVVDERNELGQVLGRGPARTEPLRDHCRGQHDDQQHEVVGPAPLEVELVLVF